VFDDHTGRVSLIIAIRYSSCRVVGPALASGVIDNRTERVARSRAVSKEKRWPVGGRVANGRREIEMTNKNKNHRSCIINKINNEYNVKGPGSNEKEGAKW